jgi:hypothetical protein
MSGGAVHLDFREIAAAIANLPGFGNSSAAEIPAAVRLLRASMKGGTPLRR